MANLNILYVEDDSRAAEAVQTLVTSGGDRLAWEQTGTGGLQRAGAEPFDVIILDRMLPDLDGLSIVSRLRAAGVDTPVLMLSALGRSENRIEGLEAGVDDYLAKPYEPQELIARLRALHRRSSGKVHGAVIIYGTFECHMKARTAFRSGQHTGKPVFPVVEQAVPASEMPGEQASPTQPFVTTPAPFARQRLTADMLTRRTPEAHEAAVKAFSLMRSGGPFTPLSTKAPTVVFPGFDGGAEWGGPAIDRQRGILFINSNDVAWTGQLAARAPAPVAGSASPERGASLYQEQCAACHGEDRKGSPPAFPALLELDGRLSAAQIDGIILQGRGRMPGFPQIGPADRVAITGYLLGRKEQTVTLDRKEVTAPADARPARSPYYLTGYRKFVDAQGYPAVAPPWGTLNAIDLNTGKYLWKIPFGEYPELVAKGAPPTGSENYGGPLLTRSGLLFIGATIFDRKFRAFDSRNGRLLWQTTLPYAGVATPTTYMSGGRQFVVIAASSQRDPKAPKGSAYIAFALPAE